MTLAVITTKVNTLAEKWQPISYAWVKAYIIVVQSIKLHSLWPSWTLYIKTVLVCKCQVSLPNFADEDPLWLD